MVPNDYIKTNAISNITSKIYPIPQSKLLSVKYVVTMLNRLGLVFLMIAPTIFDKRGTTHYQIALPTI